MHVWNICFHLNPFTMLLLHVQASVRFNWSDCSDYIGLVVLILVQKCIFCLIFVDFDGCEYAWRYSTVKDSHESFCTLLDMYLRHLSTLVSIV